MIFILVLYDGKEKVIENEGYEGEEKIEAEIRKKRN